VGADIGLHVGANFIDSFPERVVQSKLIPLLNEAGRLGEKSGAGFYKYEKRKQAKDPSLAPILEQSRKAAGLDQVRCLGVVSLHTLLGVLGKCHML
jgi:enoyl-CoA hydratase/3-hydroxyacyl-CoA dehydrogenase